MNCNSIFKVLFASVLFLLFMACDDFVLKPRFKNPEAEAMFQKAVKFEGSGDKENAMLYYNKADSLSPKTSAILHRRGFMKWNLKQYDAALIDMNVSIASSDDEYYIRMEIGNRALLYRDMGNMEKACEDWNFLNETSYINKFCNK